MTSDKKFKRQCTFCKAIKPKEELIRITKDSKTKEIKINQNKEYSGRSVYICKNIECLENALKKKKIETLLKCSVPNCIKEELYTVLKK